MNIDKILNALDKDWPEVGLYACDQCGTVRVFTSVRLPHAFNGFCFGCRSHASILQAITIDFAARKFLLVTDVASTLTDEYARDVQSDLTEDR